MARGAFPRCRPRLNHKRPSRTCPAHRAWVRGHFCSVPSCHRLPIECVHVRTGTDCGAGIKPSDKWFLSLCVFHHREQHHIGEGRFEKKAWYRHGGFGQRVRPPIAVLAEAVTNAMTNLKLLGFRALLTLM